MKKLISMLACLSMLICMFSIAPSAGAVDAVSEWQTTDGYKYPLTPADTDWAELSYHEQLEACNMPEDMLADCSTEELADLVLDYPFLVDILAYENSDFAIAHLIDTSNICKEFFSRGNAVDVLLEKYDELHVDYTGLLNTSNSTSSADCGYFSELFLQTYFASIIDSLSDQQLNKLSYIVNEKHEAKRGICDDFSTALLLLDRIQKEQGEIPQCLVPESIKLELCVGGDVVLEGERETESSQTVTSSGFSSSGTNMEYWPGVYYTVGTYTLYGVTTGCLKYYSGDYTTDEAAYINNEIDEAHPSWSRELTCTYKYNCHSYAWISASSTNVYWLSNPDAFAGSSSYEYIGNGPNTLLAVRDRIIIGSSLPIQDEFGNYTYSCHSAIVLSSDGLTRSKLGACGVYIVPINELVTFYSGFGYSVYR